MMDNILTPRERRHQKTKQAILQAAQDIITEKGADGLSLREIAHRIDYSPAGLYEYFSSKDDIIAAVCVEGVERFSAYLNHVPTNLPPAERIIQLGQAYLDFAKDNPQHFMFMFTMIPPAKTSSNALIAEGSPYAILRQAVQAYLKAENIELPSEYSVDDVAYILWAKIHGMAMLQQIVFRQNESYFDPVQRWSFEVFGRGLKAV
jgi:AcrR family transcriptional regulator